MEEIRVLEKLEDLEENGVIKVKIKVNEIKTKDNNFISCKAILKNGRLIDLRFKKECNISELSNYINKKCYIIVEELNDASSYFEYPRLYVNKILGIEEI